MITIWGRTTSSNVQTVMWAIAELGLEHERIDAGGPFGGLDTPEFAAMNPNRLVPVLRDGGEYLSKAFAQCKCANRYRSRISLIGRCTVKARLGLKHDNS